ncbi:hypothetical protein HK102_014007 [Quaeritorhiza haematococci]|nr:hypothetical protein HK102_014007 [Quaeritorhiza haematococci]
MGIKTVFSAVARVLLFVTTTLVLLASLAILAIGAYGIRTNPQYESSSVSVNISLRPVFITLLVIGIWISITSFAGCWGAITRSRGLLKFFIYALVFDMILLAAGGGYAIYSIRRDRNEILDISRGDYIEWDKSGWLVVQTGFQCCGYNKGDLETTFIAPSSANVTLNGKEVIVEGNPCTSNEVAVTFPGCKEAAADWYSLASVWFGVGLGVALAFMLFTIFLAVLSLREKHT